jgi:hypothetical protein
MTKTIKPNTGRFPTRFCDLCHKPITIAFIDGKTIGGRWGILCPLCHFAWLWSWHRVDSASPTPSGWLKTSEKIK